MAGLSLSNWQLSAAQLLTSREAGNYVIDKTMNYSL